MQSHMGIRVGWEAEVGARESIGQSRASIVLPLWKVRQVGENSLVLATLNSVGGLWTAELYLALGHLGQGKYWLGKRKLEKEVVGGMVLGLVGGFIM